MKRLVIFFIMSCFIGNVLMAQDRTPETIETDFWLFNSWVFVIETNNTFNDSCLPLVSISEGLDFGTNNFNNISRTTYTYNTDDILIELVIELWNTTAFFWENSSRVTFDYDGDNLLESLTYNWIDNAWQPDTRTLASYDTNNDIVESIKQLWDVANAIWVNSTRSTYVPNANGLLETQTEFLWDVSSVSWVNDKQFVTIYNANLNVDVNTVFIWDNLMTTWSNETRTLYRYNASNLITEQEQQDWLDDAWVNRNLDVSIYDSNNYVIESVNSDWNIAAMIYEPERRQLYTRNDDGLPTLIVRQDYESGWVNSSRTRNTYPPCSTLSNEAMPISEPEVSMYPNPTHGKLYISSEFSEPMTIEIFDINGRKVLSKEDVITSETLHIHNFPKGLYLVKISVEDKFVTKKIVVN